MRLLLIFLGVVFSAISFGQSAGNRTEKNDSTQIYIYRTGQFSGSLSNWSIYVDEQKVCKLSNNRFIRVLVKPGKHNISAKLSGASVFKKETEVDIDAEQGNNYFVACNVKMSITRARLELIEVTKSTAAKQMENMTLDNCQESAEK